jgi:hypothetical protein
VKSLVRLIVRDVLLSSNCAILTFGVVKDSCDISTAIIAASMSDSVSLIGRVQRREDSVFFPFYSILLFN